MIPFWSLLSLSLSAHLSTWQLHVLEAKIIRDAPSIYLYDDKYVDSFGTTIWEREMISITEPSSFTFLVQPQRKQNITFP